MGELFKQIPKSIGGRPEKTTDSTVASFEKPKKQIIAELGFTPKQAERFETLADNKGLVEQAKRHLIVRKRLCIRYKLNISQHVAASKSHTGEVWPRVILLFANTLLVLTVEAGRS